MAEMGRSDEARETDIALDEMNDQELMDLIGEAVDRLPPQRLSEVVGLIEAKQEEKEEEVKGALLAEFRERALQAGLTLEALFPSGSGGRRRRSDAGQPLTPKYRGPHGETWSGRGRQPNWLASLEATGHDKEEFRIKEEETGEGS